MSPYFPATFFGPRSLVELLRYRALSEPDNDAFVYLANGLDDEIHITNRELDAKARAIGSWLQEKNMRGERILLLYPPGLDFIAAFFGCLYAGAIAVPIYPPRRNRSMQRIQSIADNAQAKVALVTTGVWTRIQEMMSETPELTKLHWLPTDTLDVAVTAEHWVEPVIDSESLAFLQYTSGSTGVPKGVVLTHGNLIHNSRLIHQSFEHTRSGVGVFWLPSYHDMGLIGGIVQPLYCGRPNILMSPLTFLQKPLRWLQAITRYGGTTSGGPNFAYDLCVRQVKEEDMDDLDLSSWQVAFNGAEPVLAETMEQFAAKFERCGFRYESFYPCYGLAEATLLVTGGVKDQPPVIRRIDSDMLTGSRAVDVMTTTQRVKRFVSSGQNLIDQRVLIVDPETHLECRDGVVGEVWVKGPSVAKGYWQSPEATEYTFRAKIADTGEGPFMRTGDLGFRKQEEYYITGRIKDLIIIRGVNVYPQDIELTVQRADSHLRQGCGGAFLLNDGKQDRLVIVQELDRRFKQDPAPIFALIRKAVAQEHEIPVDAIVLVKAGSIPKTSSGKIQRHACCQGVIQNTLMEIARWTNSGSPLIGGSAVIGKLISPNPNESDFVEGVDGSVLDDEDVSAGTAATAGGVTENSLRPLPKGSRKVIQKITASFDEIAEIVLQEVQAVGKERATDVTIESDITELGLDSLERMEILAALEDRFGGQFPESVLPELITARQVIAAVQKYLGDGVRKTETRDAVPTEDIPEENYVIAKFPEVQRLQSGLELMRSTHLNHFFDVHEGVTRDTTVIDGQEKINFSSYNYIGTSGDPRVTKAAQEACELYGTSVSASRLVSGEKPIHRELETAITNFLGTEDTIVLVSGHATNETVIGHMVSSSDMILHDALSHNSIVQGAILSGARRRPFPHNDWEAADWILKKHRGEYRRVLIIAEGVYSMDGDYPDLPAAIDVKKRHKALLMIDEAHSLGVLGKTGRGICEHFGTNRQDVDLWMCTLSKTFASCGGYISGSKELVEYLKYTAPGFVFSVGIPAGNAAAALAALRILESEPQRVERLRKNAAFFLAMAKKRGIDTGNSKDSAVIPAIIGNSMKCLELSKGLFDAGINVQPILHPAVEEKAARLRFFITSEHTKDQITHTINTLCQLLKMGGPSAAATVSLRVSGPQLAVSNVQ